jgi:hypothetical protein
MVGNFNRNQHLQPVSVREQGQQAEPKNQVASIDGVGSIWSVIAKKTMRKRVSNVRARHIRKFVFNVHDNGFREHLFYNWLRICSKSDEIVPQPLARAANPARL